MHDNFHVIESLLEAGEFYYIQLLKRKQDGKGLVMDKILTPENLRRDYDELKAIAEATHSRVYINLNHLVLNIYTLCEAMQFLIKRAQSNHYSALGVEARLAAKCNAKKYWLIDVDDPSLELDLSQFRPCGWKETVKIATPNGYHLIVKPFDLQTFKSVYPDVDVHKANPTVLYAPDVK